MIEKPVSTEVKQEKAILIGVINQDQSPGRGGGLPG
jgi:hypothetical protein